MSNGFEKSTTENIIEATHLSFMYDDDENGGRSFAIDDISFSVKRGSFTAIIGRNGSGKSTLAKNLNALLFPTGGTLLVNGFDTLKEEQVWDVRRSAAMVFQNPDNQLVSTIVEDDVAFGPENLGLPPAEIRTRVDEALRDVGMYEFRRKAPHLLSGGQKQRIAIAGAIAMKPECIIFDESTAMLDPKGRKEILRIAHRLNDEGITIILITHFMEEAATADHVIIMDRSHIAFEGTPSEVFSRSEELKAIDLDIPMAVELADALRAGGLAVPQEIVTDEALGAWLAKTLG